MTRFSKQRHGFTLIELLVVISIITLLISILLPALGKARESANTVKCLNNGRQVAMTMHLYANDFDDKLPSAGQNSPGLYGPFPTVGTDIRWPFQLLTKYDLSGTTMVCPTRNYGELGIAGDVVNWQGAWRYQNHTSGGITAAPYSGWNFWQRPAFGYNYQGGYLPLSRLSEIRRPSEIIMLGEAGYLSGFMPTTYLTGHNSGHMLLPVHQGQTVANIMFVDGHAISSRADAQGQAGRPTYYTTDRFGTIYTPDNSWKP